MLEAGGFAAVKWASGPGVNYLPPALEDMLRDPSLSDAEKSEQLSAALATVAEVATYNDPFELRKLHVVFARSSGAATPEDRAICTFHFLKLTAGSPDSTWVAGDFTTIEAGFDAFWSTLRPYYRAEIVLDEYRWYRTGPQRDAELGAPGRTGPPVRVLDKNVAGEHAGAEAGLPPQIAVTVTEQTSSRKSWGRFYLPSPMHTVMNAATQRITASWQGTLGDAADTFYEACRVAGTPAVVYSAAKPSRQTKSGATLPAIGARALTVDQLQVDDILDVIRSRRWSTPLLRLQRAIG